MNNHIGRSSVPEPLLIESTIKPTQTSLHE